ncbi:MAG TPA: DUF3237 family protein [Caulobacteraceae bacterium]|nr:DUF3237 family protein [Caulobacteraceae bacterium]
MSLKSRPFLVIHADVAAPLTYGDAGAGARRCIPITGGRFEGELSGEVLPGADWQSVLPDGTIELSAHYGLRTTDGVLIEVTSVGLRAAPPQILARLAAGEALDRDLYYFRTAMRFSTGAPKLARLNTLLAVSIGERGPTGVRLEVFEIL